MKKLCTWQRELTSSKASLGRTAAVSSKLRSSCFADNDAAAEALLCTLNSAVTAIGTSKVRVWWKGCSETRFQWDFQQALKRKTKTLSVNIELAAWGAVKVLRGWRVSSTAQNPCKTTIEICHSLLGAILAICLFNSRRSVQVHC